MVTLNIVTGNFNCNGTSAISSLSGTNQGWNGARTTTGVFSITFAQSFAFVYSVDCGVISATATQTTFTQPTPVAVTAGGFQIFNSTVTGTNLDLPAGQGLQFQVTAAISSLTR